MSSKKTTPLALLMIACTCIVTTCNVTTGARDADDPMVLSSAGRLPCRSDSDCRPMGFCVDGFCASECRISEDCGSGMLCMDSRCLRACTSTADCDPEDICDTLRGYCKAPECREDLDCPEGLVCLDFACALPGNNGDGDAPQGTLTDHTCQYRSPEECADYHWPDICGHRECLYFGYNHSCSEADRCIRWDAVDFGFGDATANAAAYTGVWGAIFTMAVRNKGLPIVDYQDTVSSHVLLVRVSQDGERLIMNSKLCILQIDNFKAETDKIDNSLSHMEVPKVYIDNVSTLEHIIDDVPPMAPGATLSTTTFWEARGIRLDDIARDPICTFDDYEEMNAVAQRVWDQDNDGRPAMTSHMVGLLEAEVFGVIKWSSQFDMEVVDADRIIAVANATNEQYQIGANPEHMVSRTFYCTAHPEPDRNYIRMLRMDDFATCEDVMLEYEKDDSWIRFTFHMDDVFVGADLRVRPDDR